MRNGLRNFKTCVKSAVQRFAGWLAQICDENSRMCKIFNSNSHQKCAHARIFVAKWCQPTLYTRFQVGCPKLRREFKISHSKFPPKVRACLLDNQPEIIDYVTGIGNGQSVFRLRAHLQSFLAQPPLPDAFVMLSGTSAIQCNVLTKSGELNPRLSSFLTHC